MTQQRLEVHFAPSVSKRLEPHLHWWAEAIRGWHFDGDPDAMFGRDVYNHPNGYTATWARHMHVTPSPGQPGMAKWEGTQNPFHRTSDRILVYSLDKEYPLRYGVLLLALLGDPGGHERLIKGAQAQEMRELWDDLAYAHQIDGDLPEGTVSE